MGKVFPLTEFKFSTVETILWNEKSIFFFFLPRKVSASNRSVPASVDVTSSTSGLFSMNAFKTSVRFPFPMSYCALRREIEGCVNLYFVRYIHYTILPIYVFITAKDFKTASLLIIGVI